jgi:hypothetical protein
MSTETILASLDNLPKGADQADEPARIVRAALIEVYSEREGLEAADALMDKLGL